MMQGYVYEQWRGFVRSAPLAPPMTFDEMLAPRDVPPGTTLDLVRNTNLARPSYDFIAWLANADVYCQLHGYAGMRVRFEGPLNAFHENVQRPALALFGATEGHDTAEPMQSFSHFPRFAVEVYRRTGLMPRLRGPLGMYPGRYATITLREADYSQSRNSDVAAWITFARDYLQFQLKPDCQIVFIRDTARADEQIAFPTDPEASRNLHYRISLYEGAQMNYFVSNGPAMLAMLTRHIPYACVMKSPPDSQLQQSAQVRECLGIERGEQLPWASERQKLVWSGDSLDEIMKLPYIAAPWSSARSNA